MSTWYEVVAECKVRALVALDEVPTDERLAQVLSEMIDVGVEEHFGIVRETAIVVKSTIPLGDPGARQPVRGRSLGRLPPSP